MAEIAKILKVKGVGKNRQYFAKFVDKTIKSRWIELRDVPKASLLDYHAKCTLSGKLRKSEKLKRKGKMRIV